jgi:hypothetical protein
MNLSIYLRLQIASIFGKVKIKPTYKHLQYMADYNFISPLNDHWVEINGFPLPAHSDFYIITTDGKKALWEKGNLLVTRIISVFALLTSLVSLLINYLSK